ncbi:MAG: hypothetical protein WA173_14220 [Pseudomonas sp.]|uniref:hypothetical protein n=1 Tax=Pseudomonas sp. TaxID=306 RepID=UPI003BB52243
MKYLKYLSNCITTALMVIVLLTGFNVAVDYYDTPTTSPSAEVVEMNAKHDKAMIAKMARWESERIQSRLDRLARQ